MVGLLDDRVCFGSEACTSLAGAGADHLFSTAALTDATGTVVERYAYDAYGSWSIDGSENASSKVANSYGFTGRRWDTETDLWYFRARYYDGGLGRFIGRDPLGYVDGQSLYMAYFAPNNLDPHGEECQTETFEVQVEFEAPISGGNSITAWNSWMQHAQGNGPHPGDLGMATQTYTLSGSYDKCCDSDGTVANIKNLTWEGNLEAGGGQFGSDSSLTYGAAVGVGGSVQYTINSFMEEDRTSSQSCNPGLTGEISEFMLHYRIEIQHHRNIDVGLGFGWGFAQFSVSNSTTRATLGEGVAAEGIEIECCVCDDNE